MGIEKLENRDVKLYTLGLVGTAIKMSQIDMGTEEWHELESDIRMLVRVIYNDGYQKAKENESETKKS